MEGEGLPFRANPMMPVLQELLSCIMTVRLVLPHPRTGRATSTTDIYDISSNLGASTIHNRSIKTVVTLS